MSRAFVKESEVDPDAWPERVISKHRNLVTANGLKQIQTALQTAEAALTHARATANGDAIQRYTKERHYWQNRLQSAELVNPPKAATQVRFGHRVTLSPLTASAPPMTASVRPAELSLRVVGEDEAEPAAGLISWVSPLAKALLGSEIDEVVTVAGQQLRISQISC
jgi:transcription elongation GreA/GreB family factor